MKKVIIIGAGASGIACANELRKKNIDFIILEARSRLGGRIRSQEFDKIPIELGAEFMHGAGPETLKLMEERSLSFYDVIESHHYLKGRRLSDVSFFTENLEDVMKSLKTKSSKDESISDFIKRQSKIDSTTKASFLSFVEGFEAADPAKVSRKSLAISENEESANLGGVETFQPISRYDLIFKKFDKKSIRFSSVVKSVEWQEQKVTVTCQDGKVFQAEKCVLSVPLGVLKASALQIFPPPPGLAQILSHLEMGHVQKIIFKFRSRFWERLSERPISFMHTTPENYFPTWWTFLPLRTSHLTAWQGGPKAHEMSHWSEQKRVETALKTLSRITQRSNKFLNEELEAYHTRNWSLDPFALGAYSYISVGGVDLVKKFARPIAETLYFTGEATVSGAARGTVEGALRSGVKTAKLITKT